MRKTKIFLFLATIFLFLPLSILKADDLTLSKGETRNLLFSSYWNAVGLKSFTSVADIYTSDEEQSALAFVATLIQKKMVRFYFVELPQDIFVNVFKYSVKATKFYLFPQSIFAEVEKLTVREAINYALAYFQQNNIKIGQGYISFDSDQGKIEIWYLITYQQTSKNRGKININFYSPYTTPPLKEANFMKSLGIQFLPLYQGGLRPFIINVWGEVEKKYNYQWVGEPEIKIDFNSPVPDIPESAKKEETFYEKVEPTLEELMALGFEWMEEAKVFGEKTHQVIELLKKIVNFEKEIERLAEFIKKAQSFLGGLGLVKKELVNPPQSYNTEEAKEKVEELKTGLEETKKELESLKEEPSLKEESKKKLMEEIGEKIKNYEKEIKETEKQLKEVKEKEKKGLSKILISEVCVGWDKAENEFIELYNPNDFDIFLNEENFNLKLVSSSDKSTNKKLDFKRNKIPSKGYFLLIGGKIKLDGQEITPDANFSSQLSGTSGVIIEDGLGNVLDKVSWGSSLKPPPPSAVETKGVILEDGLKTGESLIRKDNKDTNNNSIDFIHSFNPSPTNSIGERFVYLKELVKTQTTSASRSGFINSNQAPNYPKILINEVMIAGENNEKEEFVELYNPNPYDVSLDGWYLQRKTQSGSLYSYITKNDFSGKKIKANDYFLIIRRGGLDLPSFDLLTDNPLTENNTLILKNPSQEVSDKVGWGESIDYETRPTLTPPPGKSIGRKWIAEKNQSQDTDDNSFDFEIQDPTPKEKNKKKEENKISDLVASPGVLRGEINLSFSLKEDPKISEYEIRYSTSSELFKNWEESTLYLKEKPSFPQEFYKYIISNLLPQELYYFGVKLKDKDGNDLSDSNLASSYPSAIASHLLINEIQLADEEFIELYNPTDEEINLSNYYLSYYSFNEKNPRELNDPYKNQKFPDNAKIGPKGFYLIGFGDFENADWNYKAMELNNSEGAIGIFSSDPTKVSPEEAEGLKIDLVAWGKKMNQTKTKETEAILKVSKKGESMERKVLGWDTDNNNFDFEIKNEPSPTFPILVVKLEDKTNYYNCMVSHSGGTYYQIDLEWTASSPSRVEYYELQYKINDSDWIEYYPSTLETKLDNFEVLYTLSNDKIYKFRVRAKEKGKDFTDWSEIELDLSNPVVINEVAIKGTTADPFDQWIELYNKSDRTIDLTGWELRGSFSYFTLKGEIPPHSYFLLEKKDDDVIKDIPADQIFPYAWDFSSALMLLDKKGRFVDKYYLGSLYYVKRNECLKEGKIYSLERISPLVYGGDWENWQCNNGVIFNGIDRKDNSIYGTPKNQNSIYQIYTSFYLPFVEDTTLTQALQPYLFHSTPSINPGVTLKIEPGVKIMFKDRDSGLDNQGFLKVEGTDDQKVLFTSFKDSPSKGDWRRFYLSNHSFSEINNAIIEYGGNLGPLYDGGVISVSTSTLYLSNSIVKDNKTSGLEINDSDVVVRNSQFINHSDPDKKGKAIYIKGGNVTIMDSYFENNYYGIYISEGEPILENLTFKDNVCDIFYQNQCFTFEEYKDYKSK